MSDVETILGQLHDAMAKDLLAKAQSGTLTAAEMRVALDLCKHNQVSGGEASRPNNPTTNLAETLPFSAIDSELPSRPVQ